MVVSEIVTLAGLVRREREALLCSWREQVKTLPSAAGLDLPTLDDHVPGLIDEIARVLYSGSEETIAETIVEGTPPAHGIQRYKDGFDIEEVVAEYNILRGCVHDLAEQQGVQLQGKPFHVLNRVLDGAIGAAVQAYAAQRAHEMQQRREEYLAFVAHDLRTPLNAIALAMNFLERVSAEPADRVETSQLWKILRRNVQHLELLVGNVLKENLNVEVEASNRLQQRLVDLWPLVEAVRIDLAPIAGSEGVSLVNAVPEDLLVYVDAGMVRRIFQNLLSNAISFAPGGTVSVGARVGDAGFVDCWVSDDGKGIPAHRLQSIFEKMESDASNPERPGLGLGLAIVKAFVEAHGGSVAADSEPGRGTKISLSLPRTRADKPD